MNLPQISEAISPAGIGQAMFELIADLYPICRSITGNGVRQTLKRIQQVVPIEIHEVPSGTKVFDWEVHDDWNIRTANIKNAGGERFVDFHHSNFMFLTTASPS